MKYRPIHSIALLASLCLSTLLFAQDTAQVTGTVTDSSGAAVAGAKVNVSIPEKGINRETTTNDSGDYLAAGLPPGPVNISVVAKGFNRYEAKGVILRVGQKARNDVQLKVGSTNTEVTVEGASVAQVETQSSDLSGTVTGKQITQLELNGRNFTQLVTLVPGVSNQTGQDEGAVGIAGNVGYSINGGRIEYNNWELDGGDNMDNGSNTTLNVYPSLESIGEFKVLTSNYGAQYGRNGSGTVEVETKSGTNAFHGNVYEFVRNDAFNARNFFNRPPDPIASYKKNDFGYTIGGPIWKDHTFFFWSQEWRRDRVPGQTFNVAVPSAAERLGDFSDLCPNPTNGDISDCPVVNGVQTPNLNTVPGFNINDPNVQALLAEIPAPNAGVPGAASFISSPSQPTNWREELIRVDHNINAANRVTFRYIHDSWDTVNPVPLWTNAGSFPTIQTNFKGPGVSLVTRLTSTFSPTLLNEFVFSYTTDHIILNNVGAWQRPSGATFGTLFPGVNNTNVVPGINLVGGNAYNQGFGQDAGYIPNGPYNSNPTYTYRDNLSKIVGKHNLQFGAYFVAAQKNEFGGELAAGSVPGYLTFDTSNAATTTGNPFADLLLGRIASFGQQDQFVKYYNRYKILEPYFQDDWHITPRLTLNLGLRLSLFGTYREKQHQAFNFDPARYDFARGTSVDPVTGTVVNLTADGLPPSVSNLPNGIVQCGVTAGVPVGCMKGHLFNPAPRVGFAYDPRGDGKWAIRGGYGVFFEHTNGNEANSESLENSPPLATAAVQNNIFGYSNIGAGFSPGSQPVFPLSVTSIPTKAMWPYMQQWHIDVEHEVAHNTVAVLSYVGSKGTHLTRTSDLNQLRPLPASQNPYLPGETFGANDCTAQDIFLVPTAGTTPSGAPIAYGGPGVISPATYVGIANCGASPDFFRPFPGYSSINHLENRAASTYNALQLGVRRNVGGLQLNFAYTYSHSIDDSSSRQDGVLVNTYDPSANRASSNFDQRHSVNFGYVWDLPFFKTPGLTQKILGGWEYSGIFSFSTGSPFTVAYFSDNAGTGNGITSVAAYADQIADPNQNVPSVPGVKQLYNPNAFTAPTALTYGNAGRNSLRNPSRTNFDMALFKHFTIKEQIALEFRAEAFNIFNTTQFGYINGDGGSAAANSANLNSGTSTCGAAPCGSAGDQFLQILTAHNPRILQLGLKFIF
ncbi:MAG TPA: carboxypeptidase regulatory-like domain-containing protein [Terriglobales bacterium]|nr:carboxypeptidase regulatory-like domain-containing protein [Terriglobales bacterium]